MKTKHIVALTAAAFAFASVGAANAQTTSGNQGVD